MARVIVFSGPTLTAGEVRTVVPAAEVMAPVKALDLLRLEATDGDVVVILDGVFNDPPVHHKEILALLESGVRVIGAGGHGALLAAQLQGFGMEGCGRVFRALRSGTIAADDEVTQLATLTRSGWRLDAQPMVLLRFALRRARLSGLISRADAQTIIVNVRQLPFYMRTEAHALEAARSQGLVGRRHRAFGEVVTRTVSDIPRADALDALALAHGRRPAASTPVLNAKQTAQYVTWQHSVRGEVVNGWLASDRMTLAYLQLHASNFAEFYADVAVDTFCDWEDAARNAIADPGQALSAFHEREQLLDEAALSAWLSQRRLTRHDLTGELIQAQRRTDTEWDSVWPTMIASYFRRRGIPTGPPTPQAWADWLSVSEKKLAADDQLRLVAARSFFMPSGCINRTALIRRLKFLGVLEPSRHRLHAVHLFNEGIRRDTPEFTTKSLSQPRVSEWYRDRWSTDQFRFACLDRGIISQNAFFDIARHFYLYDKLVGGTVELPWGRRAASFLASSG